MEMNVPVTYQPHPLTAQGRQNLGVLWVEGRTLREHLIAAGIDLHREVVIFHNSRLLTVSEWDIVCPVPGDLITVEATVSGGDDGSNPIAMVLSIAVMVFAPYAASALIGIEGAAAMGSVMTGIVSAGITAAISIAGNMIISALFKPSQVSSASKSAGAESPTYSLSGGSNRMRPYEPLPVVMGNHRIFPDYGSKPYTEFEGDDQYLYQVFNFGIGEVILSDPRIGETELATYSGVTVTRAENGILPGFWGNVDTTEGASLTNAAGWVTRTSGTDTTRIAIDLVGTFYTATDSGGLDGRSADFQIEYSVAGANSWQPYIPDDYTEVTHYWAKGRWEKIVVEEHYEGHTLIPRAVTKHWVQRGYSNDLSPTAYTEGASAGRNLIWRWVEVGADPRPAGFYSTSTNTITLRGSSSKPKRRTVARTVASGQYDIRARRVSADETETKYQSAVEWTVMRSYQEGVADYTDQTVLGVKIKASGQLNGALQQLSAHAVRQTLAWTGSAWELQSTTNPAWWYLHMARGYRNAAGRLLYGGGLTDAQIDIEGLKAWATFCDAHALSFSAVFDQAQTLADALQTIARCGFASPSWASGKLGVVWDAPNQTPVMAFGMANICKGSFEISYVTDNLADEIVVNYNDRTKNWESNQVRVTVPGTVGTPVKTSSVDLMGCTTNAMAAKFANALAAQQVYRRRMVTWEADFEGFVCQRGDVVILSHDLTQWGYSGRLMAVAGNVVTLSKPVPRSGASDYLMIQSPDGDTEVFTLTAGEGESDTLTLPSPLTLQSGYAAIDHKWYFSPLPTPGKKVKITSVQPLSETRIRLTATDEYQEYYAAWNGVFTQPATQTLLDQNGVSVSDLTLTLNQLIIDGFQINRVTAAWNQRGGVESCTVSAWLDGASIGTWTGIKGTAHTLDLSEQTGTVIVEVTPIGTAGPGASVIASLDLQQLPAPAAPTLTVTGGLFSINAVWTFGDSRKDIRATEIWYSAINNRDTATQLTAQPFPATSYSQVGLEMGVGWYYWARVVDTRGNPSEWFPALSTEGIYAKSEDDPSTLLDLFLGALGPLHLTEELNSRIDLIDAEAGIPGSVNTRIAVVSDTVNDPITGLVAAHSQITALNDVSSTSTSAAAREIDSLKATVNDPTTGLAAANSAIVELNDVSATSDSALARQVSQLTTTVGGQQTTIEVQGQSIDGIEAKYTVKIDNNGYVTGYGLLSTANNGVPTSEFVVNADRFAVVVPGTTGVYPFTVGTVNGVTKTVINSAIIGDASIGSAKIGDAAISTLKLGGAAVTVPLTSRSGKYVGTGYVDTAIYNHTAQIINRGKVYLSDKAIVYAHCVASQWYGRGMHPSLLSIEIVDSTGIVGGSFQGGYAVVPSPTVASSALCVAGWVEVLVRYTADSRVHISDSTLFVMGAKR